MGRKKGPAGGGGLGGAEIKEAPLQAILLADSFEETFRPVTLEQPKALLPLANVPLIEYSLEFLAEAGVKEVFVICGWMGNKVQAYLDASRWKDCVEPKVSVMRFGGATNACHAIRELDSMDRLRSDPFVLMSGDAVSNVRLKPILEAHKARRKSKEGGSNNIMTMVFSQVDQITTNRIRPLGEELAVVMDSKTRQVLKYENNLASSAVALATGELLEEHPSIEFRYNLLDCGIDICSPEMVNQIAENYDYKDLRRDYVRNEVQNRELGYRIHAHVLTSASDYACRVRDLRTYDSVSRDVIRRWLYPLVPDANWVTEETSYGFERGFRYRDAGVSIARSSVIGEDTMLGAGSVVEEGALVKNCVLGPGCRIGAGAQVEGSYLWRDVTISAGARVSGAVLCDRVYVGENAVVPRGCVLSYNVAIAAGFRCAPFSRITTSAAEEAVQADAESDFGDFTDEEDAAQDGRADPSSESGAKARRSTATSAGCADVRADEAVVGVGGMGVAWRKSSDPGAGDLSGVPSWAMSAFEALRDSDGVPGDLAYSAASGGIGCAELAKAREGVFADLGPLAIDDEEDEEDGGLVGPGGALGEESEDTRLVQFVAELVGGAGEGDSPIEHDNIVLELNGQKFAQNRAFEEVVYAAVPFMLGRQVESAATRDQAVARAKARLDVWAPTLEKLCVDQTQEEALITAVELVFLFGQHDAAFAGLAVFARTFDADQYALSDATAVARDGFAMVLSHLCIEGLVSAEAAAAWAASHAQTGVPDEIVKNPITQLVVQQLQEDSDEESDEDGSGEEGSEEEDD